MNRCVVIGSGAREHALAVALSASSEVVVTPGNDGIAAHGIACRPTSAIDIEADLFVVGPEQPLVDGLADGLRAQGKTVVGPGRSGAQLEGSKVFLKEFLAAAGVPTAAFGTFRNELAAVEYLRSMSPPYVIKTDGLAAGKGVLVTNNLEHARSDVRDKLSGNAFGKAGTTVVIEEGLDGPECSLHVLCDGRNVVPLVAAQDFKRIGDDDQGANTGGMGAYAPVPSFTEFDIERVMTTIIEPTLHELAARGIDFRGVLYAGLMLTSRGPKLLEYNVRFGDPETQVIAPLYGDRLFELLTRVGQGRLGGVSAPTSGCAVTVVLAASGYPLEARRGDVINGVGEDGQLQHSREGVTLYHSGSTRRGDGQFVTAGGRVITVSAVGPSLGEARRRAYDAASLVTFEGKVMRNDIARAVV